MFLSIHVLVKLDGMVSTVQLSIAIMLIIAVTEMVFVLATTHVAAMQTMWDQHVLFLFVLVFQHQIQAHVMEKVLVLLWILVIAFHRTLVQIVRFQLVSVQIVPIQKFALVRELAFLQIHVLVSLVIQVQSVT